MLSRQAHDELISRIDDQSVLQAFHILISGMSGLGKFELSPNVRGQKKSLHFKTGRVSYFAFIANRSWLLWYFRRPGVRDGVFDFASLSTVFPEMEFSRRSDPEKIEGIIRIQDQAAAERVLKLVESCVSRM